MILAKYIRLSDQDDDCRSGERPESNSVMSQRELLNHFIRQNPALRDCPVLEFVDDGHSGTNFDRPGFQALLEQVRQGNIQCVLVKDFSRFGRDYLEVGRYLEKVFPALGVRFLSVGEGYDSGEQVWGTAGDLGLGMRSLINELYSRDLSVRVRTARRQYAERGECVAAYAFYGYVKDPADRRKLLPDPPAAQAVRRVFSLWLEGRSRAEIARRMEAEGHPTPARRKRELGVADRTWGGSPGAGWTGAMVRNMLRDERYTGTLISGRLARCEVGSCRAVGVSKEKWIVAPDAFPPIISAEEFQAAQARFRRWESGGKRPVGADETRDKLLDRLMSESGGAPPPARRRAQSTETFKRAFLLLESGAITQEEFKAAVKD